MNFEESPSIEAHTLKEELIPNFTLLDHNVQKELVHIMELLLNKP
jgi:hypothetical protein